MIYLESRKSNLLVIIFLIIVSGCTIGQKSAAPVCTICGEYRTPVSDGKVYQIIKLGASNSFWYERGNDLLSKKSTGRWIANRDTVLLINNFQTQNFNLSVTERRRDTSFVYFGVVTNLKGEIIHDALIQINDGVAFYDVMAGDYHIAPDTISSFKIVIGSNYTSNTYRVSKPGSTHFNIQLPLSETTVNYLFNDSAKFLLSRDGKYLLSMRDSLRDERNSWQPVRLNKIK